MLELWKKLQMTDGPLNFDSIVKEFETSTPYQNVGKILSSHGMIYEATLPRAVMGCCVELVTQSGESCLGEVVGIDGHKCKLMPYKEITGINSQTKVYLRDLTTTINVSPAMLGRVVDFQGNPIDGKGPIVKSNDSKNLSIFGEPINPLDRPPIREPLDTGVNAINTFITAGKGQRLAIMAGSGVGKSTLMSMIARNTNADINVIALIGERGREVLEFIESDLGVEGLKRSVVVVATSDTSALIRAKAAYAATTIAEYFRDLNNDVILMMDSITRFSMAQREIGMSTGEPPGPKGYGPSVFAKLPKLMERAGTKRGSGTITGIYTVLVEGGDMDEPIADAVRAISDGHIVLSRELASKNHFPAIDVLESISRVMNKVVPREHTIVAGHLRDLMATFRESEDLINVGAYAHGTNLKVDKAILVNDDINNLLQQQIEDSATIDELYAQIVDIARKSEGQLEEPEGEQ
jgi:flagellum-specific ATP synthase